MKVLAAQLCPTLCNPMQCSLLELLCPWNSPAKNTEVCCHSLFQGIFPNQGSNSGLLQCRQILQILHCLSHQGSPRKEKGDSIWFQGPEWVTAAKSLQSCPTLCNPIDIPRPWDSPGKNTRVGCHFLLQCMKVKSESEVTQLYPTLSDPIDRSLPGSSIHGIFQAKVLEWGAIAFSEVGDQENVNFKNKGE